MPECSSAVFAAPSPYHPCSFGKWPLTHCGCGAETESTVITQSSIPQLAAQSAPSIMRKRGYEHINGVEGELCDYSVHVLQSFEAFCVYVAG